MQFEHLQHVRARFEPKRMETLRPEEDLVFAEEET
jgi:hypothetical protein